MSPNSGNIFVDCFIKIFDFIYLLTFRIRGTTTNLLTSFIYFYYSKKYSRFLRPKLRSGTGDEIPLSRLAGTCSWQFSFIFFISQVNCFSGLLKFSLFLFLPRLFPGCLPSYSSIMHIYDSYVKFFHGCSGLTCHYFCLIFLS